MWELMSAEQKLLYMCNRAGVSSDRLDHNLLFLAEERLTQSERERYVDAISSSVSVITYRGLSDAQIQAQDTVQRYYFNMIHIPLELKASCLWAAVENQEI